MSGSSIETFQNRLLPGLFLLLGLTWAPLIWGQYPGNAQNGYSGFPGDPATATAASPSFDSSNYSVWLRAQEENDPFPASVWPDSAAEEAEAPEEQGSGTISVAELQHPLSRKGRSLLEKAQMALRDRKIEECFQDLDEAMKVTSAVPYVYGVRGAAYLLGGQISNAIAELKRAVQVLPLPANYSNLGYAYLLKGDAALAEPQLRRALQLHGSTLQPRYLMGLILLDRKPQLTEACDFLKGALDLLPAAHIALAVCYARDNRQEAASREIRNILAPGKESWFDFWSAWVDSVAAGPHPSASFGLHLADLVDNQ